jgi:hypothetical protein
VTGGRVVTVDYISDDCMCHDSWPVPEGERLNVKVHSDGRGYVKTGDIVALYAKVQRIVVRAGGDSDRLP